MSIVASDIKFYLTGGSTNTDADASLGGAPNFTTGEITTDELNNIFDDVSASESESGDTEYRCIAVKNTNATIDLADSKVFVVTQPSESTITLAFEEPASDTVQTIADESTAPETVVFSSPTEYLNGIDVNSESGADGTVVKEKWFGLWIKRVVSASASAKANDYFEITLQGGTT